MKPEFIRIHVSDNLMKVPPDFVKYLGATMPPNFKLDGPPKGPWYVKPRTIGADLFFERGWKDFVEDNGLVYADFLVFKYLGGPNFHVTIYGRNGVQNEYGLNVNKCEDEPEECSQQEERDVPSTALEEAQRCISVSKYPCFFKVMRASYLKNGNLAIPSKFLSDYIKKKKAEVLLQIGRKSWPVQVFSYKNCAGKFYGGWKTFTIANQLQEDDVCVFELVKKITLPVLRVSIFRQS